MGISSQRRGSHSHSNLTSTAAARFRVPIIREGSRGPSREEARYLAINVSLPCFHESVEDAPKRAPLGRRCCFSGCLANERAELLVVYCVAHDHLEWLSYL